MNENEVGFVPETETETLETKTIETEIETTQAEDVAHPEVNTNDTIEGSENRAPDVTGYAAYDGTISTTYLEYFRGFISKLPLRTHYLLYRDSQYSYILYSSPDLEKSGNYVSGYANFYRIDVRNGFRLALGSGNVYEDVTSGMYYSDFSGCPSLMGGDYYVSSALLFSSCTLLLFILLFSMYRLAKGFRRRLH